MARQLAIAVALAVGGFVFAQVAPFIAILTSMPTGAATAEDIASNMNRLHSGGVASFLLCFAGLAMSGIGVLYGTVVLIRGLSRRPGSSTPSCA